MLSDPFSPLYLLFIYDYTLRQMNINSLGGLLFGPSILSQRSIPAAHMRDDRLLSCSVAGRHSDASKGLYLEGGGLWCGGVELDKEVQRVRDRGNGK